MKKKLLQHIARNDKEIENSLRRGQTTLASEKADSNNSLRRIAGLKSKHIHDFNNW